MVHDIHNFTYGSNKERFVCHLSLYRLRSMQWICMKRSRRIVLSTMVMAVMVVMLHQVYFCCWCKVPNIYKVGNVNGCYRDGYNPYALVRPQTDWRNTKNDFYCELTPTDARFGCTPVAMVFGSKFSLAHSINMSKVNKHSRISVEYHLFQWINIHCRAQSHTAHPYILHLIPICSARLHFARCLLWDSSEFMGNFGIG